MRTLFGRANGCGIPESIRSSSYFLEMWFVLSHILQRRSHMSTILLVILILLLVGALPTWPHSASWGYGPSGGLGLVVLVLVILLLTGRL